MIFGSPPNRCTALRIAARSTTSGTPVKSWSTIRATTKGISSFAGDFAFQLASALDIFAADLFAVAISEDRFENNPDADRQPRDRADALFLECGKGMKRCVATMAGVEFS